LVETAAEVVSVEEFLWWWIWRKAEVLAVGGGGFLW
jgi:hypothetical protein